MDLNLTSDYEIEKWKSAAFQILRKYETQKTAYAHSSLVDESEKGSIFYQIPEGRISPQKLRLLLRSQLAQHLPTSSPFSDMIMEKADYFLALAKKKVTSLSSFFFMIETNWETVAQDKKRNSFYNHYHPPRQQKDQLLTLTYVHPLYIENESTESFNYINLLNHSEKGLPIFSWKDPGTELLQEFDRLQKKLQNQIWNQVSFSTQKSLEIFFDSCNLLHNLKGLGKNIFLVLVINDIETSQNFPLGFIETKYL